MSRYPDSADRDHEPLTWLNGHALYVTHVIVLVYVVSMLVTTACQFLRTDFWFTWLPFTSTEVLHGQAWRVFSYGLVNPPSLWFAVDMVMLVWFGRELEKFFGRRTFLFLYSGLYLLSPLLFTVIGLWRPMGLSGEIGSFALFIAFATLYPDVPLFFNILAKWAAMILVAIYALIALGARDVTGLITLACTVGFAHGFVRVQQGRWSFPTFRLPRREPKFRVLPGGANSTPSRPAPVPFADKAVAEMDELLEKISRSGMNSLTAKERERLHQSREAMLARKAKK